MRFGFTGFRLWMTAILAGALALSVRAADRDDAGAAAGPREGAAALYTPEIDGAVTGGLNFLARQQQKSGAIGKDAPVATTALAGLAFLAHGETPGRGHYAAFVKRCVDCLLRWQNPNGYFYDASDPQSRMHGHGFAMMFLAQVHGMSRPGASARTPEQEAVQTALDRAVQCAVLSQSPEGGWNYEPDTRNRRHEGSITVCIVEGLRAARDAGIHVPRECIDRAVEYMKKSWDGKSSFQYKLGQEGPPSFALAGAGACVLIASGATEPEVQAMIRAATAFVLENRAGDTNPNGVRFWYYAYFYATQAIHFQGGRNWTAWYRDIGGVLLNARQPVGDDCAWSSPGTEAGGDKAYATAIALLILQMPNQYLPVFQR